MQPRRPARPEHARERQAEGRVAGHARRQRDDRERQQPAEGLGVDQKGVADPIEPGEEIAEAEPPAGDRRARQSAEAAGRRAIDQPHQNREREEQHRPGVERRHRQHRYRARGERHQRPPPAPAQHDPVRQARDRKTGRRVSTAVTIFAACWNWSAGVATLWFFGRRGRDRRARRRVGRAVAAAAVAVALDRAVLAAMDADLLDPARIGIQHLDLESGGPGHQLAAQRQAADLRHQIAAERVDLLGGVADVERDADRGGDVVEARARIGDERAVELPRPWRAIRPRRARRRCRRRSARRCPPSRRGRRCRRIRPPPAPDGCGWPASSRAGRAPASTAARTASRA